MDRFPDSYVRCHDKDCRVKEYCWRWLYRNTGGTGVGHAGTLRKFWEPFDELCEASVVDGEEIE